MAASVFVNDLGHCSEVVLLGSFARLDERLKTETSMTAAHRELAHSEAKKVKATIALVLVERVGNAGLGDLEIQSECCQPLFR